MSSSSFFPPFMLSPSFPPPVLLPPPLQGSSSCWMKTETSGIQSSIFPVWRKWLESSQTESLSWRQSLLVSRFVQMDVWFLTLSSLGTTWECHRRFLTCSIMTTHPLCRWFQGSSVRTVNPTASLCRLEMSCLSWGRRSFSVPHPLRKSPDWAHSWDAWERLLEVCKAKMLDTRKNEKNMSVHPLYLVTRSSRQVTR